MDMRTHAHTNTGLPLDFDIEGPAAGSDTTFILGARPVTNGFDQNLDGTLSAAVFFPSRAPAMFSGCVLSCLESLSVETAGTSVGAVEFDVTTRELILNGEATTSEFEQVLRSLEYINRAPATNTRAIQLQVNFSQYATN